MPPNLVVRPPREPDEPTQVIFNLPRFDRLPSITEQLQTIENNALARSSDIPLTIEKLPRIHIGRKEYIKESLIAGKRGRISWVYQYGIAVIEWPSLREFWVCMECDKRGKSRLYINTLSNNPRDHLKESHVITEDGDSTPETPASETSDIFTIPGLFNRSQKRVRNDLYPKALIDQFRERLIKWIVNYQIALIAVENESFRDLLHLCNPGMASFLPESGDTVRA
jgi:hypothetical protein